MVPLLLHSKNPTRSHGVGSWVTAGCAALALGVSACTGSVSTDAPSDGTTGPAAPGSPNVPGQPGPGNVGQGVTACDGPITVAPSPLRRLTHTEYNQAVQDLLGTTLTPADSFPNDLAIGGYASNRADPLATLGAEKLMNASEALAADALSRLASIVPCSPEQGDATCALAFATDFGRRAYRRALSEAELSELMNLYTWGQTERDFAYGISIVIERILQSPHFMYLVERTSPTAVAPGVAPLTGPALADRLSTFLWQTIPDETLLSAAEAGQLDTKEGLLAQATRLLDNPEARHGVEEFFNQWLDIEKLSTTEKDPDLYPDYSAELGDAMWQETTSFVNFVVFEGDSRLATLLTSNLAFPNGPLGEYYGVPLSGSAVPLDATQRSGLLTHPSLMSVLSHADQTSPVRRGNFIRDRMMCDPPPEPPPNVNTDPPAVDPNASTRSRFEQHASNPVCAACHGLLDPLGFAFENYDAMGRYRTTDGGQPINTTGTMVASRDMDGPFSGAIDLTQSLASSAQVRDCMARQWLRYALRRLETQADACSEEQATTAFSQSDGSIRELILAVVQTNAFRYRNTGAVQ